MKARELSDHLSTHFDLLVDASGDEAAMGHVIGGLAHVALGHRRALETTWVHCRRAISQERAFGALAHFTRGTRCTTKWAWRAYSKTSDVETRGERQRCGRIERGRIYCIRRCRATKVDIAHIDAHRPSCHASHRPANTSLDKSFDLPNHGRTESLTMCDGSTLLVGNGTSQLSSSEVGTRNRGLSNDVPPCRSKVLTCIVFIDRIEMRL